MTTEKVLLADDLTWTAHALQLSSQSSKFSQHLKILEDFLDSPRIIDLLRSTAIENPLELEQIVRRSDRDYIVDDSRPIPAVLPNLPTDHSSSGDDDPDAYIPDLHGNRLQTAVLKARRGVKLLLHRERAGFKYKEIGTGWLLGDKYLVTNRHVAASPIEVLRNGFDREALIAVDEHNQQSGIVVTKTPLHIEPIGGKDLAILEVEPSHGRSAALTLGAPPKKDDELVIIGYPKPMGALAQLGYATQARFFPGTEWTRRLSLGICNNEPSGENPHFSHDAPTNRGSSGSPIFSLAGEVVGVHFMYRGTKNHGISVSYLRSILARHGITP